MTVKELLEMYDNWNGITKINNDNLEMIARDRTHIISENEELTAKIVVSFGFIDGELCIRTCNTVYEEVMRMDKAHFEKFCYEMYCKGQRDCDNEVSDGGFILCNLADYPMHNWNEIIKEDKNNE